MRRRVFFYGKSQKYRREEELEEWGDALQQFCPHKKESVNFLSKYTAKLKKYNGQLIIY